MLGGWVSEWGDMFWDTDTHAHRSHLGGKNELMQVTRRVKLKLRGRDGKRQRKNRTKRKPETQTQRQRKTGKQRERKGERQRRG